MTVEAEAYSSARIFYRAVQGASREGQEGAESVEKTLAYHYKRSKPKGNEIPVEIPVEIPMETYRDKSGSKEVNID